MKTQFWFLMMSMVLAGLAAAESAPPAAFLAGGDISMLTRMEESGVVYKDAAGKPGDLIELMRDAGCTCFRLRLFVHPNGRGGVVQDVPYTLALTKRIKTAGAKLLLDFHYSDTWTDPGKQFKPKAWEALAFDQLEKQIEAYTAEVITAFKQENVLPDIVQIGNEITPGFLWPDAKLNGDDPAQWQKFTALLKAAVRGLQKNLSPEDNVRIMIHIDRGGDRKTTHWFFTNLQKYGVPYDIIGLSYYPWWHGTIQALAETLQSTADEFNKDICVVETAYPHAPVDVSEYQYKDAMTWPLTPEGQKAFLDELIQTVRSTPGHRGIGVIWWYPESVPINQRGGWFGGANALFDKEGNALPALKSFTQSTALPADEP
jgi:arabinogalactan endo-1,4-beta-galactosidase